jgi:Flp pilus assembly protein TadG
MSRHRHASAPGAAGSGSSTRRALLRDRRCVTSLELAIIAPAFFGFMLALMEIGYDLYVQAALNTAVEQAARNIQVGSVKGRAGETSAQLAAAAVCPDLHALLNCNLLTVGVEPLPAGTDYFSAPNPLTYAGAAGTTKGGVTTGGQVNTGCGGSGRLMILEAWYNGPTFVGTLIPNWNSLVNVQGVFQRVHVTTATAAFVDESFAGGQGLPGQPC